MWKLYTTQGAGVAIVSTPQRMVEAVDLASHGLGVISHVEYKDLEKDDMILRPISKGFGRRARPGFLKHIPFEHEREVRGLIISSDPFKTPADYPRAIHVHADLNHLIEEIYVSPMAHTSFTKEVESLAVLHGLENLIRISTLAGDPTY